jgi:hypothetical protein
MYKTLDAEGYDTDKVQSGYLNTYQEYFGPLADMEINLLEMGINKGGSLLLWRDYFQNGNIIGLDLKAVVIDDPTGRIRIYQGEQQDLSLLDRICNESASEGFDIIIDDCAHFGKLASTSFWHLFDNKLKSGGIYIIEDWGTGYWDSWIDGKCYRAETNSTGFLSATVESLIDFIKPIVANIFPGHLLVKLLMLKYYKNRFPSHDYGMVGFVKQLVDECAMADITHPKYGIGPERRSKIEKMLIKNGHVLITKA